MKKYIGTKMIEAERAFRIGDRIYSNENDEINAVLLAEGQIAVMGYKVRYADGYESFSPKGVFEKAYLPLEENKNLKTDAPSISAQMVEDFIDEVFVSTAGEKTTVVRAVLVNGFEILESSSCVSKENYDQKLGFEICMEQIRDKQEMDCCRGSLGEIRRKGARSGAGICGAGTAGAGRGKQQAVADVALAYDERTSDRQVG